MRRVIKAVMTAAVVAVLWAPAAARAEGYVSPFAGVNFGNSQFDQHAAWGVNAGYMGAGIIGGEFDFGWAHKPFGDAVDNHVMDLMGNLIVGIPVGGTRGPGIRPYVTGGVGLVQAKIASGVTGVEDYDRKNFGINLGVGAMGYFADHVGVRGDVRYFRTVDDNSTTNGLNLDLGGFQFWRASVGLVIR